MFLPPPLDPARPHVLTPVRVDPSGLVGPTPDEARGPRWRRTSRGWYLPSTVPLDDVEQRITCAVPLLREGESIIGWAALRWLGAAWFQGIAPHGALRPVTVATARHLRQQPGFRISQESVRPAHRAVVDGLPVTSPAWSACFEARYAADWRRAVEVLDMAAYSDLVSRLEAAVLTSRLNAWTVEPPPWWVRTDSVDRRRAFPPATAARLLGYRRSA